LVSFILGGTAFDEQHIQVAHILPAHAPPAQQRKLSRAVLTTLEADMMHRLTGLSSMATRHILADLVRDYERLKGIKVEIRSMGGVEAAKLARAGEPTDVVALASKVMEGLEAEGHIAKGSIRGFARSEIALAVLAGSRRPALDNENTVRQAMIEARRLCYSTGPSGDHFKLLCDKWGLADSVLARALKAPPGVPVATLVANGDADLGIQQLSELVGQAGIEVVGPLPAEIQAVTVFAAGVSTTSTEPEAASALVAYLASAETQGVIRRHGMEPA
jgi:molybdate transport system substrate-binding protein